MRFFFHLRDVSSYEEDHEGIEFPSLAQAVAGASGPLEKRSPNLFLHDDVVDGRTFEIAGDAGRCSDGMRPDDEHRHPHRASAEWRESNNEWTFEGAAGCDRRGRLPQP